MKNNHRACQFVLDQISAIARDTLLRIDDLNQAKRGAVLSYYSGTGKREKKIRARRLTRPIEDSIIAGR